MRQNTKAALSSVAARSQKHALQIGTESSHSDTRHATPLCATGIFKAPPAGHLRAAESAATGHLV
jgi:hypothetical protein